MPAAHHTPLASFFFAERRNTAPAARHTPLLSTLVGRLDAQQPSGSAHVPRHSTIDKAPIQSTLVGRLNAQRPLRPRTGVTTDVEVFCDQLTELYTSVVKPLLDVRPPNPKR